MIQHNEKNSCEENLWLSIKETISKDLHTLVDDAYELQRMIEDIPTPTRVRLRLTKQVAMLRRVIELKRDEFAAAYANFSCESLADYSENFLSDKARELKLLMCTYGSLHAAIVQRVNALAGHFPSRDYSLNLVDMLIGACYSMIAENIDNKNSFAHLILQEEWFRPIPYFEKRDIEYPLEYNGIILTSGIGVPSSIINAPWNLPSLIHEMAHDLDRKFALSSYHLRQYLHSHPISDHLKFTGEIKQIWLGWLGEIIPDMLGVILLGPAYVHSLFSLQLQTYGLHIAKNDDGYHPQPYVRGLIALKTLELTSHAPHHGRTPLFEDDMKRLRQIWEENTFHPGVETVRIGLAGKEYSIEEITAPMEEYLTLLLHAEIWKDFSTEKPIEHPTIHAFAEKVSSFIAQFQTPAQNVFYMIPHYTDTEEEILKTLIEKLPDEKALQAYIDEMNLYQDRKLPLYLIAASYWAKEHSPNLAWRIHSNLKTILLHLMKEEELEEVEQLSVSECSALINEAIERIKEAADVSGIGTILKKQVLLLAPGPGDVPPGGGAGPTDSWMR